MRAGAATLAVAEHGWLRAPIAIGTPVRAIIILVVIWGGMGTLALWIKPYEKPVLPAPAPPVVSRYQPYDIEDETRKKEFLDWLKKQGDKPKDTLRIACISSSEKACAAAGQFLLLFSEAGWKIDRDRVFHMEPQIPIAGVAIASPLDPKVAKLPKLPPHLGRWHKMSDTEVTITFALRHLGVPTNGTWDATLPKGMTGVYFGPEPPEQPLPMQQ